MLFCYILQKAAHFSVICYRTEFGDSALSGASVALVSEVRTAAILVLLLTLDYKA
jgi:hypothetical protein